MTTPAPGSGRPFAIHRPSFRIALAGLLALFLTRIVPQTGPDRPVNGHEFVPGPVKVFNVVGEVLPAAQIERVLRDYYAGRMGDEDLEDRLLRQVDERRFRDIHAVSQQIQARQSHFETAGAYLLGLDPDPTFL